MHPLRRVLALADVDQRADEVAHHVVQEGVGAEREVDALAAALDLAKAYEEMGDKDGARELLKEVVKDGDAAQKGQAQQLLTKLG